MKFSSFTMDKACRFSLIQVFRYFCWLTVLMGYRENVEKENIELLKRRNKSRKMSKIKIAKRMNVEKTLERRKTSKEWDRINRCLQHTYVYHFDLLLDVASLFLFLYLNIICGHSFIIGWIVSKSWLQKRTSCPQVHWLMNSI
jgi:hypothetical protein